MLRTAGEIREVINHIRTCTRLPRSWAFLFFSIKLMILKHERIPWNTDQCTHYSLSLSEAREVCLTFSSLEMFLSIETGSMTVPTATTFTRISLGSENTPGRSAPATSTKGVWPHMMGCTECGDLYAKAVTWYTHFIAA